MCFGRNYKGFKGCDQVCVQIGPKAGVGREEKEPHEGKNHGQAVGGTGDGSTQEPARVGGKGIVGGKRILLWKRLLEQTGYDMEVVKFMTEGVPLVGSHDHPSCYSLNLKAACMSEEELRDSALSCRTALENRRPQTEAWPFAEHVEETAAEEVKLQFLEGPFYSSAEVSEELGHDQWRIMRQFVIQQGSKLRPIDDGLEAQLNAAYTSTIRLDLQDADCVVSLTLELGKTGDLRWVGKTLDLSVQTTSNLAWP